MSKNVYISPRGYMRPKGKSQTQKLSKEDIKEKLKHYKRCDIAQTPLTTHIRYFVWDKEAQTYVFRIGGFLKDIRDAKKYIILSQNWLINDPLATQWSVTTMIDDHPTLFYAKMTKPEIAELETADKYKEVIEKRDEVIKKQHGIIKQNKIKLLGLDREE